ncbi:recombinase family protein [Nonomuraea sp. B19D2]|uniref:recombinase family protein n=1 Tax=Nonomuraea sp. B19D2 TaxID=3159561 RepID=UPI0032DAE7E1
MDNSTTAAVASTGSSPVAPANAIRVGYARISTRAQDHLSQMEALAAAHCREIVEETASTRKDRPKLQAAVAAMKAGDTLVIYKPDRVARSVKELLVFLEDGLAPRGINLEILSGICAGLHRPNGQTIADKMLFLVAAMAAEMERDLISERTLDGLAAARAQGRVGGRPAAVTDDLLAAARARRGRGQSVTQIARELGIGRSTLYRALEDDEPPVGQPEAAAPVTSTAAAAPSSAHPEPSQPAAVQQDDTDARRHSRPGAEWDDTDVCLARADGQWHLYGPDGEIDVDGFGFAGAIGPKNEKWAKEAASDAVAALTGRAVTGWDRDAWSRSIYGESTWYACLSEPSARPAIPGQDSHDDSHQDHGHEDQEAARVPQLRAAPQLGEDYQTARWPYQSDRLHLLHHGQPIGYVTGYTGRWRALTPGHDPITLDAVGPDATHRTQAQALAAIALHARYQETRHTAPAGMAVVDDGQALTEASGEGPAGQGASAVPAAPEQAQPVDQQAPATPAAELYLVRLDGENVVVLADGQRVGWLQAAPDGWHVHGSDGQLVTTLPADDTHGRDVLHVARIAAAALGIPGAELAAVTVGPLTDRRGRIIDTSPTSLASWSLLKGREPGRTDVIVRGRCVGWLQRDDRGRDVACTLDGPVPGSASTNRVQAVTALLAAQVAPAPLPDLGPEARTPRRPRARSPRERPICPFTPAQLAAAALADNLPRLPDGSYRVHIHDGYDDTELGRVFRSGRRWQALTPDGRVVVHRAASRTEAVDRLLATPGPLFGDPADTVLHDL